MKVWSVPKSHSEESWTALSRTRSVQTAATPCAAQSKRDRGPRPACAPPLARIFMSLSNVSLAARLLSAGETLQKMSRRPSDACDACPLGSLQVPGAFHPPLKAAAEPFLDLNGTCCLPQSLCISAPCSLGNFFITLSCLPLTSEETRLEITLGRMQEAPHLLQGEGKEERQTGVLAGRQGGRGGRRKRRKTRDEWERGSTLRPPRHAEKRSVSGRCSRATAVSPATPERLSVRGRGGQESRLAGKGPPAVRPRPELRRVQQSGFFGLS